MSENKRGPTVFAILPLGKEFDRVYREGIREACREAGAGCVRVAAKTFTGKILRRIQNSINKADLVVADLTGRDSNVLYELGYASSLNKPVIMLARDLSELPFDLREQRLIVYDDDVASLRTGLRPVLEAMLGELGPEVEPSAVERDDKRAAADEAGRRPFGDASKPARAGGGARQVFISYSHKDRFWLEKLKTMYAPLVWSNDTSVWDDTLIGPGEMWERAIGDAVESAKVAVLLVSPNFMASPFIVKKEVPSSSPPSNRSNSRSAGCWWRRLSTRPSGLKPIRPRMTSSARW
jgi:hypothetical protein